MALALCHILPRDQLMRICVLLLMLSFLLTIIAFGKHASPGNLGKFDDPNLDEKDVMELTGDTMYSTRYNVTLCPKPEDEVLYNISTSSVSFIRFNYSTDMKNSCNNYVTYTQSAAYVQIFATVLMFIAIVTILLAIVPCSNTTARMVAFFWIACFAPLLASVVGTALFDAGAIPAAKDFLEAMHSAASSSSQVVTSDIKAFDYKFGFAFNLAIASNAFLVLAFLLATFRLIHTIFVRPNDKGAVIARKDIGGLMQLHLVNDDWARQRKMWAAHAKQVECDIVVVTQQEKQPADADQNDQQTAATEDDGKLSKQASAALSPHGAGKPGKHQRVLSVDQHAEEDDDGKDFKNINNSSGSPSGGDKNANGGGGDAEAGEPSSPVFVHQRRQSTINNNNNEPFDK